MSSELSSPRSGRFKRLRQHETLIRAQVAACIPRAVIAKGVKVSPKYLSEFLAFYNIRYDKSALSKVRATHMNLLRSNPGFEARRQQGHRESKWTPEMRAAQAARTRTAWKDPEKRENMASGIRMSFLDSVILGTQQELARRARDAKAEKRAAKHTAAQAEAELQARLATLSPFERQLELVRLGRMKVVERAPVRTAFGGTPLYR